MIVIMMVMMTMFLSLFDDGVVEGQPAVCPLCQPPSLLFNKPPLNPPQAPARARPRQHDGWSAVMVHD